MIKVDLVKRLSDKGLMRHLGGGRGTRDAKVPKDSCVARFQSMIAVNLADTAAVEARAADWQFSQFYPASCTDCGADKQQTAIIDWRLANDSTIREAFYETDADATNRFFTSIPTQAMYRDLILTEHGALNAMYPNRYKTFIVSGDCSHTALQSPLFYTQDADGVLLNDWTKGFLANSPVWANIVEDFMPAPQPPCP